MIILGLINFSDLEEERLFGYWKKKNKELKRKELLDTVHNNGIITELTSDENKLHFARSAQRKSNAKEIGTSIGSEARNINKLINKRAYVMGETAPLYGQNSNLDPESIKFNNGARLKDGFSRSEMRKSRHGRVDSGIDKTKYIKLSGQAYKEYKEALADSIKKKEEKIKHLKKIKNLKRAGLIGAGVVGAAGLTYGGYKLYKNRKKKED